MPRSYFGTDGVRGVAGDVLSADLALRLGRAATLESSNWATGAGAERGLEHLAGLARVADDEHPRALRAGLQRSLGEGLAERERELGRQQLPRDASDAVGPEQLAGHVSEQRR